MCHAGVVAPTVQKLIDVEIMWKIDGAGRITAGITAVKDEELPDLPRFGIRMFLDKKLSEAAYYGMGPQESYRDKHRAASHGLFRSSVQEFMRITSCRRRTEATMTVIMWNYQICDMESLLLQNIHFHLMPPIILRKCLHRQNTIMSLRKPTVRCSVLIMHRTESARTAVARLSWMNTGSVKKSSGLISHWYRL